MPDNYFNTKRDNELIATSTHFWCEACMVARPIDDKSQDPRYCLGCCEVLKVEAELLPSRKRPAWVPRATENDRKAPVSESDKQGSVSKIIQPIIPPITKKKVFMKQRGRPRKESGVSRVTRWRREKEAVQGELL